MGQRGLKGLRDEAADEGQIVGHLIGHDDDLLAERGLTQLGARHVRQHPIAHGLREGLVGQAAERRVGPDDGYSALELAEAVDLSILRRSEREPLRRGHARHHREERPPHLLGADQIARRELHRIQITRAVVDERAQQIAAGLDLEVVTLTEGRPCVVKESVLDRVAAVQVWLAVDHLTHEGVVQIPASTAEEVDRVAPLKIDKELDRLDPHGRAPFGEGRVVGRRPQVSGMGRQLAGRQRVTRRVGFTRRRRAAELGEPRGVWQSGERGGRREAHEVVPVDRVDAADGPERDEALGRRLRVEELHARRG